jgi:SAM-dependent methyltransferase
MDDQYIEQGLEQEIGRETEVHGEHWGQHYDGYFGDETVVAPFLEQVHLAIAESGAGTVVDLGGGTGFVLAQYIKHYSPPDALRLVNLDLSEKQLQQIENPRIETCRESLLEFSRAQLSPGRKPLLPITRSTLHYAGLLGLKPVLHHIRQQMLTGELFIHQSICCDNPEDALLLSEVFERLDTHKWLPPGKTLDDCCREAQLEPIRTAGALPLPMSDRIMGYRYHKSVDEMAALGDVLEKNYPDSHLWKRFNEGYVVYAPYRIFTCRAV